MQVERIENMLSALKNFGVTFLIAAILFGIIAYFATGFVTSTVKDILEEEQTELDEIIQSEGEVSPNTPSTEVAEGEGEEDDKIPEGESFNFIVFTTDYRPDLYNDYSPALSTMYNTDWYSVPAEETAGLLSGDYRTTNLSTILLVRIDKEKRQVMYSYITPEARVYTPSGYHTLSEVYTLYGKNTVTEHINAMTGLRFRYSLLMNGYNLDEFIELTGTQTVHSARDIYHDGTYPTMEYETTAERIGEDGNPWTEHIPNTWLQSAGDVTLNRDNLYNMLSVDERSMADINAKSAYVIDIMQKYLANIAAMEDEDRKILLAKLIMREDDWKFIEGLEIPEEETETQPVWEEPAEEEPAEVPEEEFDPASRWKEELFEPDTPILDTNYTMNDYDAVKEMLAAVAYFEPVIVTYPITYKAAVEEEPAYFAADTSAGLELYLPFRIAAVTEE